MSLLRKVAAEEFEKPSKQLSIRLKPSQLELLQKEAAAGGVSVNELVSRLVMVSASLPEFAPAAAQAFDELVRCPISIAKINEFLEHKLNSLTKYTITSSIPEKRIRARDVKFWSATAEFSVEWTVEKYVLRWVLQNSPTPITATISGHGTLRIAPSQSIRVGSAEFDVQLTDPSGTASNGFNDDDLPF